MTWQVILPPRKLKKSFWVKNIFKKSTALRCFFYHGFLHIPEYMGFSKSGPQRNSQCHRNADGYQSIYKGYDAFLYGDGVNGRPNTIIYEILYDDGFGNIKYYIGH